MSNIWYFSPSNQSANIGIDGYGTEKDQMYRLVEEIVPHLDRAGVSFHVADPGLSISDRAKESNEMSAVFHLCFHSNAGGGGKALGPVALYYSERGKEMGKKLVSALLALGQKNNRSSNLSQRKDLLELRKTTAPACLLEVDFHDSPEGVDFITRRRSDIAKALAQVIIEADGKEFVPVTSGEYVDEAVKLGLFPRDALWDGSLTREEAARLAVKLYHLLKGGT